MIYIYTKNGKCVARKAEIMNAKRWRVWIGECWNVLFIWGNYGWPSCTAREMLIHDSGWVSFSICRDWSGCIGVMYTSVVMKVLMPAWTRIWACNSACWHLCPLVIANLLNVHGYFSRLPLSLSWLIFWTLFECAMTAVFLPAFSHLIVGTRGMSRYALWGYVIVILTRFG